MFQLSVDNWFHLQRFAIRIFRYFGKIHFTVSKLRKIVIWNSRSSLIKKVGKCGRNFYFSLPFLYIFLLYFNLIDTHVGGTLVVCGPLATNIIDATILYNIIAGPDVTTPYSMYQKKTKLTKQIFNSSEKPTIGVDWAWAKQSDEEVFINFKNSISLLENEGYTIKSIQIPELDFGEFLFQLENLFKIYGLPTWNMDQGPLTKKFLNFFPMIFL
jgi:hypothetical protein